MRKTIGNRNIIARNDWSWACSWSYFMLFLHRIRIFRIIKSFYNRKLTKKILGFQNLTKKQFIIVIWHKKNYWNRLVWSNFVIFEKGGTFGRWLQHSSPIKYSPITNQKKISRVLTRLIRVPYGKPEFYISQ